MTLNQNDVRALIAEALLGGSLDVDGGVLSLHDMTQLAVALTHAAKLVVRNSANLAPLEKASIGSVARGAVQFA